MLEKDRKYTKKDRGWLSFLKNWFAHCLDLEQRDMASCQRSGLCWIEEGLGESSCTEQLRFFAPRISRMSASKSGIGHGSV